MGSRPPMVPFPFYLEPSRNLSFDNYTSINVGGPKCCNHQNPRFIPSQWGFHSGEWSKTQWEAQCIE